MADPWMRQRGPRVPRTDEPVTDAEHFQKCSCRATTHRLLACLVRERMVRQRSSDRHYFPGPLLFELSLANPVYEDFQAAARAPVERLYRSFGTMAALFLRSGCESVCTVRAG